MVWSNYINTSHAAIDVTMQNRLCFLKIQKRFHELLNQYKVCLYLFECIFHGGYKYGIEVQ